MNQFSNRILAYIGLACVAALLVSCASTKLTSTSKEPTYDAKTIRRAMVIAVVRKPKTQKMLEDEFIRNLQKRKSDGIASYTLVREGEKLDEAGLRKLVADNQCDTVILMRLVDYDVVEKDVDPKYLGGSNGSSYGYYSMSYATMYQPGFSLRKETAAVETRVFDVASDKMVWSVKSKTNIEEGRDPEAQVRDFVSLIMKQIYK